MPALEKQSRHQKAVLWIVSGSLDNEGEHTLQAPKQVLVRYNKKQDEVQDAQGNPVTIEGTILVDEDIATGGIIWLGALRDLPSTLSNLLVVFSTTETPDIKGRQKERTLIVKKHSDTLPTLA